MDVNLSNSDSDSSVKLDSWILLNNIDEITPAASNTNNITKDTLLEHNVDSDSTNTEISTIDENNLITKNAELLPHQSNAGNKNEEVLVVEEQPASPVYIQIPVLREGSGDNVGKLQKQVQQQVQQLQQQQQQLQEQQQQQLQLQQQLPQQDEQEQEREQPNEDPADHPPDHRTDFENYVRVFEEHLVFYRPVLRKHLIELFNFLLGLTLGSFFITVCGLALMFLGQTTMLIPRGASPRNSCSIPFDNNPLQNQTKEFFDSFYKIFDEDELINQFCTNKYKQFLHKGFKEKPHPKDKDRYTRKIIRNYSCYRIDLTPRNYTVLNDKFNQKSKQFDNLRQECDMKEDVHKKCVETLLSEINNLTNEIYVLGKEKWKKSENIEDVMADNVFTINKKISEEIYKKIDENIDVNEDVYKISNITLDGKNAKKMIKKRIKTMKKEYEELISSIKEKQKALYNITSEISAKLKLLESKKKVIHLFQDRLSSLMKSNKTIDNSTVPIIFDNRIQMTMSNDMLNEIINAAEKKKDYRNICLYEEDLDFQESDGDIQKKKREIHNLINRKLEKLIDEKKKNYHVAKWDDKTIWLSRKLNDQEHERLNTHFPKCNPSKGWFRHRYAF